MNDRITLVSTVRCAQPRHERIVVDDDDEPTSRFVRVTPGPKRWLLAIVYVGAALLGAAASAVLLSGCADDVRRTYQVNCLDGFEKTVALLCSPATSCIYHSSSGVTYVGNLEVPTAMCRVW